jgi:L-fuconolactonase
MRIDAHQHFWTYHPSEYDWITEEMPVLRRDYLPGDLKPLMENAGFDGTIAVQARQKLVETRWLLELAGEYDFIRGVVGWVDLRNPRVRGQLEEFADNPKLSGVRHVVHDEPDDEFVLREDFQRGIGELADFNLTYDLLTHTVHLPPSLKLVDRFPNQPFVIDHISKPLIQTKRLSPWKEHIREIAQRDNVMCKLSGMVTETTWREWRPEDFTPYMDVCLEAFGPDRMMVGSDWPVCRLSGDYVDVMTIATSYVSKLSPEEQEQILGGACARFYGVTD